MIWHLTLNRNLLLDLNLLRLDLLDLNLNLNLHFISQFWLFSHLHLAILYLSWHLANFPEFWGIKLNSELQDTYRIWFLFSQFWVYISQFRLYFLEFWVDILHLFHHVIHFFKVIVTFYLTNLPFFLTVVKCMSHNLNLYLAMRTVWTVR